ncbi:MAG: B3/4 domain-containing protein [Ignavibacteriales bacterium]
MTRFVVHPELFDAFPEACFGVVVAEIRGHGSPRPSLQDGLNAETGRVQSMLKSVQDVRAHPNVLVWRDAFTRLGLNPNRFPSSIEALLSRVAKGGVLPAVNPVVDGANIVSLRNLVPIGAHDMETFTGDIEIRMSREGDLFIPFGHPEPEPVPPGELVYASGNQVRTRKWVWRQSEVGKILPSTTRIFFPIDGFTGKTDECVRHARRDLAAMCRDVLGAIAVRELWVDAGSPFVDID